MDIWHITRSLVRPGFVAAVLVTGLVGTADADHGSQNAQDPHSPPGLEGKPERLAMWVQGDGSGAALRARFVYSTGQTFQPDGPKLDFTDWRYVTFPLDGTKAGYWGGAKDGVVHYPIKLETILLIDNADRQKTRGTVHVSCPTVVYRE